MKNFLDAGVPRSLHIEDAITILEARSAEAHETVATALTDMADARARRASRLGLRPRRIATGSLDEPIDKAGSKLIAQVQAKRQAIAEMEDFRRRRTIELQSRLREQRAAYSDNHPVVLDLQQSLEALGRESPEILGLRRSSPPWRRSCAAVASSATCRWARPGPARWGTPRCSRRSTRARRKSGRRLHQGAGSPRADPIQWAPRPDRHRPAGAGHRPGGVQVPLRAGPPGATAGRAGDAQGGAGPSGQRGGRLLPCPLRALAGDLASRKLVEPWQIEQALGLPVLGEVSER